MQMKDKVKGSSSTAKVIRKELKQVLFDLRNAPTTELFDQKWHSFKTKCEQNSELTDDFVQYMESYWYRRREYWAECHRSAHGLIETNNYIESWHSVLKRLYIGSSGLKRS
ncbi:hypothetical protein V1522DRAFT_47372 [Lipomyces starkeyi]